MRQLNPTFPIATQAAATGRAIISTRSDRAGSGAAEALPKAIPGVCNAACCTQTNVGMP